ncbi:Uncharacterized protein FWK35_00038818 [Aphis craccivora]|uniref:Ubiquitin-like protease family profile domain-containing protein n=1 Tax=Aphis craccivora TaxID=307492 RepID=A0A6G0VVZ2_APHCR|nr:Uncharacterized protein FWK35_00038818 [Aphis craccivora]
MIPTATNSDSVKRRFIQKSQDNEITPTKICRTHSTPKRSKDNTIIDSIQLSSISSYVVDNEIPEYKPITISDNGHTFLKTHTDVPSFSINNNLHNIHQDTFEMKYDKLHTFRVCGRDVNKKHLEPLYHTEDSVNDNTELYLYGSIISVYLSILCHEENNNDKSVTFFTCDDMILSHYHESETALLKVGMREFLTYRVPEYDIILLPVCKFNHCYLIVVFTKLYIIMFLDSNLNSVNRDDIKFTLKLFKLYYKYFGRDFDEKRFTIYRPKVFQQFNGYDCGVYACLFGETIIKKNNKHHQYHLQCNLPVYKNFIKNKILDHMKKGTKPPTTYTFDETKLTTFPYKCCVNISTQMACYALPGNADPMDYLTNIANNYWADISFCDKSGCPDPQNQNQDYSTVEWVYCKIGHHWFHIQCMGLNVCDITENSYICPSCKL